MHNDSWVVFGLFVFAFIVNLIMLYNGHDELNFGTAVLFGFWLGSCRW